MWIQNTPIDVDELLRVLRMLFRVASYWGMTRFVPVVMPKGVAACVVIKTTRRYFEYSIYLSATKALPCFSNGPNRRKHVNIENNLSVAALISLTIF